jgi:hypothetical protein
MCLALGQESFKPPDLCYVCDNRMNSIDHSKCKRKLMQLLAFIDVYTL